MDKQEKLQSQGLIIEFLRLRFKKIAALREISRPHVYECANVNSTMTSSEIVDKAERLEKSQSELKIDEDILIDVISALSRRSPLIFNGRNYVTIDKDQERAIQRLHTVNKKRDINLFEVEFYKGYWIIYD